MAYKALQEKIAFIDEIENRFLQGETTLDLAIEYDLDETTIKTYLYTGEDKKNKIIAKLAYLDSIKEMYENGQRFESIAQHFGVSKQAIHYLYTTYFKTTKGNGAN